MKRALLLIVVPALLVALGFAQTPAASVNPDQTIKGCLGGSDGNYTAVEDGTGHIFKITANSIDFNQHLGHDVTLIGRRTSGASSAAADDSFAVTELNMISEHCAAAAAAAIVAPAATASTPSETAVIPPAAAAAPAATTSTLAETIVTPAADVAPPAATATTPAEIAVTPTVDAAAPAETASAPAADAADSMRLPARFRRLSATPDATAIPPAVTANTPGDTASTPAATPASPDATASTPAAVSTTPAAPARHGALGLLIAFAVLIIITGTLVPFLSRLRKRKLSERTGAPNLSFTREASSDQEKPEQPRKAA